MAAVFAPGCGSGPATKGPSSAEQSASATSAADSPPSQAAGPIIDVTIAAGAVTPTNAQAEAVVGQPIALVVSSDAADSIHVHSIPEHVFDVQPQPGQRFEFTVQVPGSVDVELHDLHRTIVTIAVRP
jgi:hypothetical protein